MFHQNLASDVTYLYFSILEVWKMGKMREFWQDFTVIIFFSSVKDIDGNKEVWTKF